MTRNRMRVGAVGTAALLSASMLTPAFAGSATSCDACALEARVATLEAQMAQRPAGGVNVPSDLTIKFGGYIKADFIYDVDNAFGPLQDGNTFNAADDAGFQAHARQTRFNFTATKDTALGPIRAFFEGDWFGASGNQAISNSNNFRMRHAIVEWNGWLAGQFWTLFMPLATTIPSLDFHGAAGAPFLRQGQLRYTYDVGNGLKLAVSAENPETVGDGSTNDTNEDFPDFVAGGEYIKNGWMARLFGVVRDIESPVAGGGSETGYGINVGGAAPLWAGGVVKANFTWGQGIGRYIVDSPSFGGLDFNSTSGFAEDIETWGFFGGISQQLTDVVAFNAIYGRQEIEDTFQATDFEMLQSVHVNLIWTPVERYSVGIEGSWFESELVNGDDADVFRIQSSVQFNF